MGNFWTWDYAFTLTRYNTWKSLSIGAFVLDVFPGLPCLILADMGRHAWNGVLTPLARGIQNTCNITFSQEFKDSAFTALLISVQLLGAAALGYCGYKVIQGGSSIAQDLSNLRSSITFSGPDFFDKKLLGGAVVGILIGAAITGNQSREKQ